MKTAPLLDVHCCTAGGGSDKVLPEMGWTHER